jgi:uncharacterized protein (TIGR02266 family)
MATASPARQHADAEIDALLPALSAVPESKVRPVSADPHAAAITGLLVADYMKQPEILGKLRLLGDAGLGRESDVHEVGRLARAILALVERLGGEYLPDGAAVAESVTGMARALRSAMIEHLERSLPGSADARLWLDAIRRGTGNVDLVFDLRVLAALFDEHREALHRPPADDAVKAARVAWTAADAIERALRTGESPDERETRRLLVRAWTLFVATYDEVCATGRFVTRGQGHERHFPPLAMIAAHRRAKRRPASLVPARLQPSEEQPGDEGAHANVDDAWDVELLPRSAAPPPLPAATPASAPAKGPPPLPATAPPPLPATAPSAIAEPVMAPAPVVLAEAGVATGEEEPESASGSEPESAAAAESASGPGSESDAVLGVEGEVPAERPSQFGLRSASRHYVEAEVNFGSDSNFYLGFTENLSTGGVFVATYVAKPIGTKITLELLLPNGARVLTGGTVRWLRLDSCDGWPGMGVQFDALSEVAERAIREVLPMREPLFYPD